MALLLDIPEIGIATVSDRSYWRDRIEASREVA
jgi:hypothetical protein